MRYTIPAKPTRYADTCFRSRLEARWAAMFDLLRWPYVYEPFDLGYWSPDFLVLGAHNVLVEVKPILSFSQEVAAKMEENLARWLAESGEQRSVVRVPSSSMIVLCAWAGAQRFMTAGSGGKGPYQGCGRTLILMADSDIATPWAASMTGSRGVTTGAATEVMTTASTWMLSSPSGQGLAI